MTAHASPQTRFTGEFKELIRLFLPIALMTLSGNLVLFIERLWFAHLSTDAMEAAVSVIYVYLVFQGPCITLAMMAQIYVGRHQGAGEEREIGSAIWQFIWFSVLSTIVLVPLGILCATYYFENTIIADIAVPYFYLLLTINFLYPLGASLSCFYIGRGKTRLCLFTTLGSYIVNLLLAYALIFGVEGWIPSLGLMGGAISNLVAQGGLCLLLLIAFLSPKHAQTYGTHKWHFHPKLFWAYIYPGLLRAMSRLSILLCYCCMAHMMMMKGGDYLLFWSIGGAISLFLPFFGEAICQSLTTVLSNIVGSKNFQLLGKAEFSGYLLVSIIALLIGIPMLLLPQGTFHALFPDIVATDESISKVFFGLWFAFAVATLTYVPVSRILAFKDTKFLLVVGGTCWISYFLAMYVAVNWFAIPADQFWTVLALSNLTVLALYVWRANWLNRERTDEALVINTTP